MRNVYFSTSDYQLIREIIDVSHAYEDLHIVGFATSLQEDGKKLKELNVDVYVLQFTDNYAECAQFLASISENIYFENIELFALLKDLDIEVLQLLIQYDIKNFLLEPIHAHHLMNTLQVHGNVNDAPSSTGFDHNAIVNRMMQEMGIPMHLSGFQYIKTCSLLVFHNTSMSRFVVGNIYKECARIHNTTASRVEKAIRTAITYAFRTQPEQICIYNDKPTNSQIILYLGEKLKQYRIL